ncbi:hypothetical protein L5515_019073 [Caenorhabditis briggsae]|uniref:Uncharacterized protein n=1 Tax=Caenorhabditis briggsae TaxID=6238 RepID=A0AAE9FIY4_CAEBR|nr:hypothetical protein L5515_019073 [Caenorhabditis briggsae]
MSTKKNKQKSTSTFKAVKSPPPVDFFDFSKTKEEVPEPIRIPNATNAEQKLYELCCKARGKGLFVRIPPSHPRARKVAEEIEKYIDNIKRGTCKPLPGGNAAALKAIKDLKMADYERGDQPGWARIISILREEFRNYSSLAFSRGLQEKGEIFQFIAHYPKCGLILQRVNVDRPYRYDGVIDQLVTCTHPVNAVQQKMYDRAHIRTVSLKNPAVKNCSECEEKAVKEGTERLDRMDIMLVKDSNKMAVDSTLNTYQFEKDFKVSGNLLSGTGSLEYSQSYAALKNIRDFDKKSVELRETMFKLRLKQQQLTARVNIYGEKEMANEWEKINRELENTAMEIVTMTADTVIEIKRLEGGFEGSWELIRESLGTPSRLCDFDRKVRVLEEQVEEKDAIIAQLRHELEEARAMIPVEKNEDSDGEKKPFFIQPADNTRRREKNKKRKRNKKSTDSGSSSAKRSRLF